MIVKHSVFMALLCLAAAMPLQIHAQPGTTFNGDEPESWLNTFTQVGVPTIQMYAVAAGADGTIYLGGGINQGNNVSVTGPAVWMFRDNTWSSLDTGFNGTVFALALGPDGTLYAGGSFTEINSVPVNGIAMFNGESWEPMGAGLMSSASQQVNAIVVSDSNVVYAGGRIGTYDSIADVYGNSGMAAWYEDSWNTLGSGLQQTSPAAGSQGLAIVNTLDIDDEGEIWVGGRFLTAGSTYVQNIAAWIPGTGWSRPGLFIPEDSNFDISREVVSIEASSGADLIITGIRIPLEPIAFNSETSNYLRWNGELWIVPEHEIRSSTPGHLARGSDGTIYVSTTELKEGYFVYNILRYRNGEWARIAVGTGEAPGSAGQKLNIDTYVRALAMDRNDHLIATGEFRTVAGSDSDSGRLSVEHAMRWDGSGWHTLGNSVGGRVFGTQTLTNSVFVLDMATSPDGLITMGGWIGHAGGVPVNGAVNLDPETGLWSYLADSLDAFKLRLETSAILYDDNGTLIIGGNFKNRTNNAGNEILYGVASWNGSDWQTLGDGITGQSSSIELNALHKGSGGDIFAAGSFRWSGETLINNIARWDGTSWLPLGNGLSSPANAMTSDVNGHLIVGGSFPYADGTSLLVRNIARWDGESWHAMGNGLPSTVFSLITGPDGTIFAGTQGGKVYRWDGSEWVVLGGEFTIVDGESGRSVHALAFDGSGRLYAGGGFNTYDGQTIRRLARWDGETWAGISPGIENLDGSIQSLLVHNETLYMGGQFRNAGGRYTTALATWNIGPSGTVDIADESGTGAPSGFLLAENYPNPFNPSTTIRFSVPEASSVTLEVFDLLGRRISLLTDRELSAGSHQAVWDASGFASGVYLYRLTAGSKTVTGKMMLMK
jgi:trimeric autotransporter adhesin